MTDENHVLVVGPNGRHIEVHKRTQAALPDAFPLVKSAPPEPRKRADRKTRTKKPADIPPAEAEDLSGATVPEINTVDEEGDHE